MRKQILLAVFSIGLLGLGWSAGAQESPRAEPRERKGADLSEGARAVLQIKSEAGICYWSITGDDDLVRLPVADERFPTILLSARFGEDQLHLTLAGERAPLDTSALGQFDLGLLDGSPVTVNGFRAAKAGNKGWELRVLPPHAKVDTSNCCSCGIAKLSCCPNKNYCIGCGVCGDCCG